MLKPPPYWPRLLSREQAASYCGVSPNHFDAHCPIKSVRLGARRLWDRHQLDQWVDLLVGAGAPADEKRKWLDDLMPENQG